MKSSPMLLVMELISHDKTILFSAFQILYFGSSKGGAVTAPHQTTPSLFERPVLKLEEKRVRKRILVKQQPTIISKRGMTDLGATVVVNQGIQRTTTSRFMANQQTGKQTLNWRWSRYDSHNMRDKGTTDNQEAHTFQQRTRRDYSKINLPNVASQTNSTAATSVAQKEVPKNIHEALQQPEWRQAIREEIKALKKNGTWELSNLLKGKHLVGCKWIFTIKFKPDGSIERYKARLVAKGFAQTYSIYYQETFILIAKLNTIRVLLSLAINLDEPFQQLDVKKCCSQWSPGI
ncbi:Retrovirus-related Pol polyprotein from transposon TNT 1-94 [Vitis vinifera]|uniref:Retrovirus-related Pol polyprotein from transposon TNT 1-94 n=1 Tax=Vitis vinifera TaxID=29760 RepID=A0A438FSG9_VITVI|nr:Retrovirus-related Pol polyprotein from transposon TNT 1-94 [Vitis vinifera]